MKSFTVVACARTGQLINDKALAEAVGCDPGRQAQMVSLYEAQASLFQRWQMAQMAGSDSSDDEGHGRTRPGPETAAILACLEPGCERYFRSSCRDIRMIWCPSFLARLLFCQWVDWTEREYACRCYEGSAEGRAEKALAAAISST